jgi:hypothetical protein
MDVSIQNKQHGSRANVTTAFRQLHAPHRRLACSSSSTAATDAVCVAPTSQVRRRTSDLYVTSPLHYLRGSPANLRTALEVYLSRSLALVLLTLSLTSVTLSGLIPLPSLQSHSENASGPDPQKAFATPITLLTTLYHFVTAFLLYGTWYSTSSTLLLLGLMASGGLAAVGTFACLFAGDTTRISKRTGKDKRVSGWPLGDTKGSMTKNK